MDRRGGAPPTRGRHRRKPSRAPGVSRDRLPLTVPASPAPLLPPLAVALSARAPRRPLTGYKDALIFEKHAELGNKWADIAAFLPGRTDNLVKNRYHSTMRRLERQQGRGLTGKGLSSRPFPAVLLARNGFAVQPPPLAAVPAAVPSTASAPGPALVSQLGLGGPAAPTAPAAPAAPALYSASLPAPVSQGYIGGGGVDGAVQPPAPPSVLGQGCQGAGLDHQGALGHGLPPAPALPRALPGLSQGLPGLGLPDAPQGPEAAALGGPGAEGDEQPAAKRLRPDESYSVAVMSQTSI